MAREAWPKQEVIDASRDVVCLAVYRWRRHDDPETPSSNDAARKGAVEDGEWAIRLDVRGYPQIRLLDGWGRPLPSAAAHEYARDAKQVVAAMDVARKEGRGRPKPDVVAVPAKLLQRLPEKDRAAAADPIGSVRCRTWLKALEKGAWSSADMLALLRADDDPVLRLRLIERIGEAKLDDAAAGALADAVDGTNDYVRGAALKLLGKTGGARAVALLAATIGKGVDGGKGWKNPNNVLCDAVEASIATPDKALVDPLGRVLATQGANNQATLLATRSLVAVGRKFGADLVRAHLERARKLEGPLAAEIRREVATLLGT
jgi:HEAT repeat protein